MAQYLVRRVGIGLLTLWIITVLNFAFIKMAPGDPVMLLIPQETVTEGQITQEWIEEQRKRLGLDRPIPVQYLIWLKEISTGNMGRSLLSRRSVAPMVRERVGPTLRLTLTALALSMVIGISVGVFSAIRRYSLLDYTATFLSFIAVSIPNFFLALVMVYLFALKLGWLPTSGMYAMGREPTVLNQVKHLILPATVLGLSAAGSLVRYSRSSMLEVMRMDYVTTARAKGLPQWKVYWHAFRNGLLPIITVISLSLPHTFGGSVIIEQIFTWPGMGTFAIQAVFRRDYPVIMAVNLVIATLVLVANLVADVAYSIADPRIRYS